MFHFPNDTFIKCMVYFVIDYNCFFLKALFLRINNFFLYTRKDLFYQHCGRLVSISEFPIQIKRKILLITFALLLIVNITYS